MTFPFEVFYVIGTIVLLAAMIWAVMQYRHRNRANDPIREEATRELYRHPESYPQRREELKKEVRPS